MLRKIYVGKDQSNQYNVYAYDFKPQNYTKTLLITSCIHGNEYSAFYALSLVVNEWNKYSQLAYIRKTLEWLLFLLLTLGALLIENVKM